MPHSSSLTASPLFEIRENSFSGRGIYATRAIAKNTLLFETSDIAARVIYREYRKEGCAQCFKYDGGRDWKIRDVATGTVFCSEVCQATWTEQDARDNGIQAAALSAVEGLGKRGKDGDEYAEVPDAARPTESEIEAAWTQAEEVATRIRNARTCEHASKADRKAVAQALAKAPLRDILSFLLSGVLCAALEPEMWEGVLDLVDVETPYRLPHALQFHITSYYHLLACCPVALLPNIKADNLRTLARKGAHNVFNIWSQDLLTSTSTSTSTSTTDSTATGSECLGYALWPSASYFNHSCAPNVHKQRNGRTWKFWAQENVEPGQELCITYLGGDEKEMSRGERVEKLRGNWGFECACLRCKEEEV